MSKSAVILAERKGGQPEAILAWSYPGRLTGHEFLYSRQVQAELAKDKHDTIVLGD